MPLELQKDENGNVITKPVTGWVTMPVADIAVLLAIQYAERPEEIETGGKQIQLVLMPQQCLELAETLTTQAKRVLGPSSGKAPLM